MNLPQPNIVRFYLTTILAVGYRVIERWFRFLKCEYVYINEFNNPHELRKGITDYIRLYNHKRPHSTVSNYPMKAYQNRFSQAIV